MLTELQKAENTKYVETLAELKALIPEDEYRKVVSQTYCEYDDDFLGFVQVYRPLAELIPKDYCIIDFGCYLAAQSYFFKDHKEYIGVDRTVFSLQRFAPQNASHFYMSIQEFIRDILPKLPHDIKQYCAICSFVPDFEATELVRKTFPNVFCFYPSHNRD